MLITRKMMIKVEGYFVRYPKLFKQKSHFSMPVSAFYHRDESIADTTTKQITEYDAKMFRIVEKTKDSFSEDKEKSFFIEQCIIGGKVWEQAYDRFHIEKRTYSAWKREILFDATIFALLDGLIGLNAT